LNWPIAAHRINAMIRRMHTRVVVTALLWLPLAAQEHAGHYTPADVERGLRLYGAHCQFCHGANGDSVPNADLRGGRFRHATSDEDLARVIAAGIPGTAMPPHKFDNAELTGVVAYIRSLRDAGIAATATGDPSRGRRLFETAGGCTNCHRIRGHGSRFGPDLSEIGAIRSAQLLENSLLDPTASMLPINRSVRAVTRDGKTITGRRLNEDTYSVQIIDSQERLISLIKADLREYAVLKTSPMPSYKDKLSGSEVSDVVAYLLTLKGVN
jgi:putative heme-binding domain-containing protein